MLLSRLTPKRLVRDTRGFYARAGASSFLSIDFLPYLSILGPGLIAANAGNDASGIATYSSTGAAFGYTLLWVFIPMTISLIVVQEMCVRMGVVTGQGLADLIREQFGVRWTAFVMLALLVANTGVIISEFCRDRAGVGAAGRAAVHIAAHCRRADSGGWS
jgi:Mn2+/Fe2+ NRAMP family transporter